MFKIGLLRAWGNGMTKIENKCALDGISIGPRITNAEGLRHDKGDYCLVMATRSEHICVFQKQ